MSRQALTYNPRMPRLLPPHVSPIAIAALAVLLALVPLACAHDVNGGATTTRYPAQVNIGFRTRGSFEDSTWYYMVFNFTAAPSIDDAHAPVDDVSGDTRGKNWEMYIGYHHEADGGYLVTLQRPRIYTLLDAGALGPTDCAVGDFNSDNINDIAIACKTAGAVQIIYGKTTEIYKTTYFKPADDIVPGVGTQPVLLYAGNVSGTDVADLVVLYAGDGATQPFLRVLESVAESVAVGGFKAKPDIQLGGTPVDALLLDLNNDTKLDLAVLTTDTAGQGSLRIFTGDGAGGFAPGAVLPAGLNPVQLATGHLDALAPEPVDLVVANRGNGDANGTGSSVMVFKGNGTGTGDGTFTAVPSQTLNIPGPCEGVAVGKYFGSMDDIGVTYIGSYKVGTVTNSGGLTAVYLNETTEPLTSSTVPSVAALSDNPPGVHPNYMLALDTGNMSGDPQMSSVVLSGRPGTSARSIYIQRSDSVTPTGGTTAAFSWIGDTVITYQTEPGPSRIRVADLNKDGISDFIIPCPNGDGGTTICLYYGLGKSNYTSADIYWTDNQPYVLGKPDWLIGDNAVSIGPNSIQLSIDPLLFYDLAGQAPYMPQGFNVDFMTADEQIDINEYLPPYDGKVIDILDTPVNVKMESGFLDDEQNSPRAQKQVYPPSQDIDYWSVEVI
jgi:hypothetical protein